jgi:hypothetical protein
MKTNLKDLRAFIKGIHQEHPDTPCGPLSISRTEFKDVRTGNVAHGFLIHNDFTQTYVITPGSLEKDPVEVLDTTIVYANDVITGMLDNAREHNEGIMIDDFFYEWKHLEEEAIKKLEK